MEENNSQTVIANKIGDDDFFWRKKTFVYYFMSVMVFILHCSSFSYYTAGSTTVQNVDNFIHYKVCMVAVPMFFALSAMLFFRNYKVQDYFPKLKKRFKTLVIPYLSWNTINMLFNIVATLLLAQFFVGRTPFEWSFQNVFEGIFHYKYYLPFWFLFELIFFVICTPVIELVTREKYAAPFIIAIILFLNLSGYVVPYPLFRVPNSLIYYLVGAYAGRHLLEFFTKKVSVKLSLIGILLIAAAIASECVCDYKFFGDFTESVQVLNKLVYVLGLWWVIDLIVNKIKIFPFMKNSFMVFALHVNISAIVSKLIYYVLPKYSAFAYVNLLLTLIITLVIIELICMFMKRFCRKLYGVLTGSR